MDTRAATLIADSPPRLHPGYSFLSLQILGWGGLCVVTFLSLTVWYGTPTWNHVNHTIAQAVMGALLCLPLRRAYRALSSRPRWVQIVAAIALITLVSGIWTGLRMQAFLWLTEEYDIWKDFGGWYFGSFMVFLSWSAIYAGLRIYRMLERERDRRQRATLAMQAEQLARLNAEAGTREARMKMLRYQINPHFLFNTLNSVSALIKTGRPAQARDMLGQLAGFLRYTLEDEPAPVVALATEFAMLDTYLALEGVRHGDRLKVDRDIAPDTLDASVPSLILQPLVENALAHAIADRREGGTVRIGARLREGALELSVEDSGSGLSDAANADPKEGVGLSNIRRRLAAHYGEAGTLAYGRSDLGGLAVRLSLPVRVPETLPA